jgi:hypothetical protein
MTGELMMFVTHTATTAITTHRFPIRKTDTRS